MMFGFTVYEGFSIVAKFTLFDGFFESMQKNKTSKTTAKVGESHYFLPIYSNEVGLAFGSLNFTAEHNHYLFKDLSDLKDNLRESTDRGELKGVLQVDINQVNVYCAINGEYVSAETYDHDTNTSQAIVLGDLQLSREDIIEVYIPNGEGFEPGTFKALEIAPSTAIIDNFR